MSGVRNSIAAGRYTAGRLFTPEFALDNLGNDWANCGGSMDMVMTESSSTNAGALIWKTHRSFKIWFPTEHDGDTEFDPNLKLQIRLPIQYKITDAGGGAVVDLRMSIGASLAITSNELLNLSQSSYTWITFTATTQDMTEVQGETDCEIEMLWDTNAATTTLFTRRERGSAGGSTDPERGITAGWQYIVE